MKPRALRTTRLACALAALGASLSAHAQYSSPAACLNAADYQSNAAHDAAAGSPYANGCIRDLSDQRAAVLLPSALKGAVQGAARSKPLAGHAWGFLDQNGRLAIPPIFRKVGDFRHGLAAVNWQGKWGFIDTRGRMAVRPQFDAVQDYAEIGLAVATLNGRKLLIDRQGNPVGEPLDESIDNLHLLDGVPALAIVEYRQEYRSSAGERRFGDAGVRLAKAYGNGLYVAADADDRLGLVDEKWDWVLEPTYDDISVPAEPGALGSAHGPRGAVLLDPQGKPIGEDQRYRQVERLDNSFWSAELPRGSYAILDATGAPVAKLTAEEAYHFNRYGDLLVYRSGGKLMALAPGRKEPLSLGPGVAESYDEQGYVLFQDKEGVPAGLLTPKGVWLRGDSAPAWLAEVGPMKVRQGKLWLFKQEGELLNVVDADGRVLLKPETVAAVQEMALHQLPLDVPDGALGLLGQGYCHCATETGAGLVLADGSIVADPSWTAVIPLDGEDEYGGYESAKRSDLKAEQLRYAAETAGGMKLLDAAGKPMDLPPQQHIGTFRQGYALAYADGVSRMIDRDGKTYALPDYFETEVVAPGVVRFLETASEDASWGLYDFVAGKEISPPRYRSISAFQDGMAVASLGPDKVGVVDLQGRWTIPASRHGADAQDMEDATYGRMGDWMAIRRAPRLGYLDAQGHWQIAPGTALGGTFRGAPARALLTDDDGARLIDAQGKTVATLPGKEWSWPEGSATLLRRYTVGGKPKTDYAGLDGKPRLTVDGDASGFSDGYAVSRLSTGAMRAVNAKGALTGPAFDALGPLREGLATVYAEHGYGYANAEGKLAIAAKYETVSPFRNSRAVASTMEMSQIIDPAGKQVARVEMQCGVRVLYGSHDQRLWPLNLPGRCRK